MLRLARAPILWTVRIIWRPTCREQLIGVAQLIHRFVRLYFVIALALLASAGTAVAANWQVTDRHGTVLMLNGKQWDYLPEDGEVERGIAIRTLKVSTITVQLEGYVLRLEPNTAARFENSVRNTTVVTQFAGVVTVQASAAKGRRLLINTPAMAVYVEPGTAVLTISSETGEVDVAAGVVTVLNAVTSASTTITAGETFVVTAATTGAAGNGKLNGNGNANGVANGAANGNGTENGNNGNGNSTNNAGGNGGGNGSENGNAGGNGNNGNNGNSSSSNNAGGNATGNQGNNGVGNGTNNGNGNGGGNGAAEKGNGGNGNGNGNGKGNSAG